MKKILGLLVVAGSIMMLSSANAANAVNAQSPAAPGIHDAASPNNNADMHGLQAQAANKNSASISSDASDDMDAQADDEIGMDQTSNLDQGGVDQATNEYDEDNADLD
jgi:hypothetical protein